MIKFYISENNKIKEVQEPPSALEDLIWVDMIFPTAEEEHLIEKLFLIDTPTHEEMLEIEVSSRLYVVDSVIYTTATLVTPFEKENPETQSVTFIFKEKTLITLRYSELKPFNLLLSRCKRNQTEAMKTGADVFIGLTEAIVDRLADALEMIGRELDKTSSKVFQKANGMSSSDVNLKDVLKKIGRNGDLNGKLRESLLSLSRVIVYLLSVGVKYKQDHIEDLEAHSKDVIALNEYTNHLSNRINLLLDATLGMINIEQNSIIKIFSVAATVFLPPTLIASIYGMNFKNMPELDLPYGYPLALGLMVLFAVLPYLFFKRKKWL